MYYLPLHIQFANGKTISSKTEQLLLVFVKKKIIIPNNIE